MTFDFKMSYGDPPYRSGGFTYELQVEEAGGEALSDSCKAPIGPRATATPRPFDHNLKRTYTFLKPGPHAFSMSARPACSVDRSSASVEGVIDVLQPTSETSHHWHGSDGERSVDLVVVPKDFRKNTTVMFFAAFERTTNKPMSWRLSFGDGTKDKVGGHACRPDAAGAEDMRFDRAYDHHFSRSGDYEITVDLSDECLSAPDASGEPVISETVHARYK